MPARGGLYAPTLETIKAKAPFFRVLHCYSSSDSFGKTVIIVLRSLLYITRKIVCSPSRSKHTSHIDRLKDLLPKHVPWPFWIFLTSPSMSLLDKITPHLSNARNFACCFSFRFLCAVPCTLRLLIYPPLFPIPTVSF